MRDTKSLLLLLVSFLLVLVSFVLIWTWGYSFYSKNNISETDSNKTALDSAGISNKIKDSLEKVYASTLRDLDIQLDSTLVNSDSLRFQLDAKLAEFYRLRSEITAMLQNKNGNGNMAAAQQKIGQMQAAMDDLKQKNQLVDKENKKLLDVLSNSNSTQKITDKNSQPFNNSKSNNEENSNAIFSVFTASDLRLSAVTDADDKATETNDADKADKLTGAFTVTNFNSQLTNAEMMVVVLKPDGKILKSSGWDSGTFNTAEGKKIYSYKFNFVYSRGEAKRLAFSLRGGTLSKGNYTMEVYNNGVLIGKVVKALS